MTDLGLCVTIRNKPAMSSRLVSDGYESLPPCFSTEPDRALWISEAATWGKPCCRLDDYSERRGSLCKPTTRDELIHSIQTIPVHHHEVLYQFGIGIDILIATPVREIILVLLYGSLVGGPHGTVEEERNCLALPVGTYVLFHPPARQNLDSLTLKLPARIRTSRPSRRPL